MRKLKVAYYNNSGKEAEREIERRRALKRKAKMLRIQKAPEDVLFIRWCFFRVLRQSFPFRHQRFYVVTIGI